MAQNKYMYTMEVPSNPSPVLISLDLLVLIGKITIERSYPKRYFSK